MTHGFIEPTSSFVVNQVPRLVTASTQDGTGCDVPGCHRVRYAKCRTSTASDRDLRIVCQAGLTLRDCQANLTSMVKNDVKKRRLERGLSQAELAKAVHVSRQTINSIETSKYVPSLPLALALGRFFDAPVEEMFDANESDD